jgi:hypothetical protein
VLPSRKLLDIALGLNIMIIRVRGLSDDSLLQARADILSVIPDIYTYHDYSWRFKNICTRQTSADIKCHAGVLIRTSVMKQELLGALG